VLNQPEQGVIDQHVVGKWLSSAGRQQLHHDDVQRHAVEDAFEIIARFTEPLDESIELFEPNRIGSSVVWLYPIAFLLQPGLIETTVLQNNALQIAGMLLVCISIMLVTIAIVQIGRTYPAMQAEPRWMTSGADGLCRNTVYVGLTAGFLGVLLLLPSNVPW